MRDRICKLMGAVMLAGALAPSAQAAPVALGFRTGTLGLYGLEGTLGLSDRINLRVPLSLFDLDYDDDDEGVDYQGKLKLQSFGAQIDLHPFRGSFYLTAGLFANGNQLKLRATDSTGDETYELGDDDVEFTSDPNDPLTLDGRIKFRSTAPFLGLGWGNAIQGASSFYFRTELGALFQGASKVRLRATGSAVAENGQSFRTDDGSQAAVAFQGLLAQERESLEADISEVIKIYPSITFAFGFRFGGAP